jgi:hypothetical protein
MVIFLQIVKQFKGHTLSLSVIFLFYPKFCIYFSNLEDIEWTLLLKKRGRAKKYLEFIAPVYQVSLVSTSSFLRCPIPTKTNHVNTFGLSATPNPLISKTVLRPLTYGKHQMLWCPILHEVHLFKTVPLRNKVKKKVKCTLVQALRLCKGRTAHRASRGIVLPFLNHGTRRGEGSASRPGRSLPPEKTRYPMYSRLGEPRGRSGQLRKIWPPPGFDPRTVQPVASRYTDWGTRHAWETRRNTKVSSISKLPSLFAVPRLYCHQVH